MKEMSMSAERFKEICREAMPEIKKLQEITEKHDIKQGIRVYIGDDGYFRLEGSGLEGWELCNYGGETTIRHEYKEVLKYGGGQNEDDE